MLPDADVDPAAIAAAAQALQVEAARWARLRVGEELSYEWPRAARRHARPGRPHHGSFGPIEKEPARAGLTERPGPDEVIKLGAVTRAPQARLPAAVR